MKERGHMRILGCWAVALLGVFGPATAGGGRPAATSGPVAGGLPFEAAVPAGALAFFSCPDATRSEALFQQTALYDLWREPEVQTFLKGIVVSYEAQQKALVDRFHIPLDLVDRFQLGQIALSIGGSDSSERGAPSLAIGVQVGRNLQEFRASADALLGQWAEIIASSTGSGAPVPADREYGGCKIRSMALKGKDLEICYTFVDSLFVGALNGAYLERIIDTARNPKADSLLRDPLFQAVSKKLQSGAQRALGFVNLAALRTRFAELIPENVMQILKVLGLDVVQAIAFSHSVEGKSIRDTFYVHAPGERRGLLKVGEMRRNKLATAAFCPRDTLFFDSNTVDCGVILDGILEAMKVADPASHAVFTKEMQRVEQMLGFRLRQDLLASLSDEKGLFVALPSSGGLVPEVGLVLELRDAALCSRCLDALLLSQLGLQAKRIDFSGTPVTYVDLSNKNIPFSPAFGVSGKFLLLGGSVQTVKQMLARQTSHDEGLLGHAEFKAMRVRIPEDASWIEFLDLRRACGLLASSAPALLAMAKESKLPIEPLLCPTAETLSKHMSAYLSTYRYDSSGFTFQCESPVGSGFLLLAFAGGVANLLSQAAGPDQLADEIEDRAEGGPSTPRERAVHDRMAGRYDRAVRHYTQAIEKSPADAILHFERGTAYHALKDFAHAREDFQHAANAGHFPDLCQVWIARTQAIEGDREAALKSLEAAIRAGYAHPSEWANEPDLASLKDDARFREWTSRH